MPASKYDIVIEQGASWELTITLRKKNKLPLPLTDYIGKSHIKKTHKDELILAEFWVEITDEENGTIVMRLSDEQTSVLDFTTGVYDLILISPEDNVVRVLEGNVKLSPRVTARSGYSGYSGYSG